MLSKDLGMTMYDQIFLNWIQNHPNCFESVVPECPFQWSKISQKILFALAPKISSGGKLGEHPSLLWDVIQWKSGVFFESSFRLIHMELQIAKFLGVFHLRYLFAQVMSAQKLQGVIALYFTRSRCRIDSVDHHGYRRMWTSSRKFVIHVPGFATEMFGRITRCFFSQDSYLEPLPQPLLKGCFNWMMNQIFT